ncbi:MAG: type II secretion system secretin GspD [Deltaproteobacteria bacterium]|nr:type II secretion system secretin GspD [Deltaproteobacteria bacterium]
MRIRATAAALAGISLLGTLAAAAQPAKPPPAAASPTRASAGSVAEKTPQNQLITMDFQDVEIGVLVKFISEITGRNFILDEKVRGKVTVISPTKISIEEAYRVFQSILEVKGFTTLPAGPVTKIVPVREARESGAPLATRAAAGDEFVTQLVPLSFTDASTLVPVLQPMVSKEGLVSAYDPANTLVLIDTASNIERLLGVISELDIEMPERGIEIIHLDNSYAQNVAATLQQVLEAQIERAGKAAPAAPRPAGQPAPPAAGPAAAAPFKIIADERTNSVVALARPAQMRTIRKLVQELDKKLEGVSKINVVALKYANAVEMVQVLSELIGTGRGGAAGPTSGGAGGSPRRTTRRQQLGSFSRSSGMLGAGGLGSGPLGQAIGGAYGGSGGAAPGGAPAAGGAVSASGGGGEFVGEVRVTADPYTNSLLISAAPQDYDVLRRVIAEIDIPRRQVYVEAIILEISLDKSRQLGFEYQGGTELGNEGIGLGRLNLKDLNTALTAPQSLSGLVLAAASNQTITLPDGTKVPAQVALFSALQSDTDVNILSAPNILTSDNQEAEILVGQNIPFIASRATDTTNLANTFATVERQDVGITLRLTPQISQGDVVRLDLYEEVSAVVPNPPVDPNIAGPTTTVRSASTTIVARDGHTVALGGLISDNVSNSQSKIPFLGDIPGLGNLFRNTDDRRNKVNLLVFLTPHIVRDESDLEEFSLDYRDRFQRSMRDQKTGPRRREQLDAPSWQAPAAAPTPPGPALAPAEPPPPASSAEPRPAPPPPPVAAVPRPAPPPPAPILPSSPGALGIPVAGHRFAVLLALLEKGTAPPELQSTSGFLTVYMPLEAGEFFAKGAAYEYASSAFEAKYTCLEIFPDAATALSVYPEGRPLERLGGAVVRWKPISAERLRAMIAGDSPWKRSR